jgi:hypothetical protein
MKRLNLIYSVILFIFTYIIYITTTAPDLTFTDSGELATVCSTLGIAHSTGYPLFTILGHLWTYLPIPGSEIYSLNLYAGFMTAISVAVFFNTLVLILSFFNDYKKPTQSKIPVSKKTKQIPEKKSDIKADDKTIQIIAIALSLLYAFAGTIWAQAVAIEVYSLHLLLMNLVLFFIFKATFSENSKPYYILTALFLGLSFTNHMTTVLLIPMILFLYFKKPGQKADFSMDKIKLLLFLLIPFFIGFSLYLYLPLRSAAFPELNWGFVSRGFDKFWYHFSGRQYQVWMFSGADVMKDNLVKFFVSLPSQFAWAGLLAFIFGLYVALVKSKTIFWGLIILILTCISYAINYSIHDIESYFVTAYIGMFLIASAGILKLVKSNKNYSYALFVLPLIALIINYSANDRSKDYLVPEYTKLVFQNLEPNAVVLSAQWDFWVSSSWYLQRVKGYRPDVVIIDKELLRRTWYIEQLRQWYPETMEKCKAAIDDYLIDLELFEADLPYSSESIQRKFITMLECFINSNYEKKPIYLTLDVIESEQSLAKNYQRISNGFAFRLIIDNTNPLKVNAMNMDIRKFKESILNTKGYLVDGIKTLAAINLVNTGRYALMTGDKEQAQAAIEKAYQLDPQSSFVQEALNYFNKTTFE